MPSLDEMIAWSGSGAVLSLFVVVSPAIELAPAMSAAGYVPNEVTRYEIEPVGNTAGFRVFEFDAHFDVVAEHLSPYLAACRHEALGCVALVAWFGFEGSSHFDHLLTPDIDEQIFGVADSSGIGLVTDACQLSDDGWAQRVATAKERRPWPG